MKRLSQKLGQGSKLVVCGLEDKIPNSKSEIRIRSISRSDNSKFKILFLWFLLIPFLALGEGGESHYLKAKAYEKQGDFSSAIIEYKKALQIDPNSIFLKKSLAYACLYNKEENLALSLFLEVVKNSKDPQDWRTIGNIYARDKRYKTAIEAYNKGLAIREDIDTLYDLAEAYLFAKRVDDAISTYKRIANLFPYEEPALLSLGLIYDKEGRIKEARKIYEGLLSINKENIFAMKRLIVIYLDEDLNLAEELAYKLVEKEKTPQTFFLLGMALEKNKKEKEAEECYKRTLNSSFKEGVVRLGWLL
ncbi:MAG: tetratricopeptide repeat protein [bacterium]